MVCVRFKILKTSQQVVYQEELFEKLQQACIKTEHGGINVMWHQLRNFYEISKLVI